MIAERQPSYLILICMALDLGLSMIEFSTHIALGLSGN